MNPTSLPRLMTEADVAQYLDVNPETVARERRRGRLRYIRIGNAIRFREDDVRGFAEGAPPPAQQWPTIQTLGLPELRLLPDPDTDERAATHGVYFLWLSEKLVYVGQSANVRDRVGRHIENREYAKDITTSKVWGRALSFDGQSWLAVPWPFHLAVEAAYIAAYQPPENRKR